MIIFIVVGFNIVLDDQCIINVISHEVLEYFELSLHPIQNFIHDVRGFLIDQQVRVLTSLGENQEEVYCGVDILDTCKIHLVFSFFQIIMSHMCTTLTLKIKVKTIIHVGYEVTKLNLTLC